jgi:hypothetical protein
MLPSQSGVGILRDHITDDWVFREVDEIEKTLPAC